MSVTRGRVSEKRDAENIPTRKPQCFQAMGVRLGGLAPLTPPFKQGVRSSNLRRVTKKKRHALACLFFFMIATVAVGSAGGEGIFADEVCCAAGFRHGVIKVTQGGREIEQPQLFHQLTDAAGGKARLKAGTIRIFKIVHIPGARVAVGSAELRGKFHAVAVFLRIRPAAALAAINAHGRRHHGPFVVFAQE